MGQTYKFYSVWRFIQEDINTNMQPFLPSFHVLSVYAGVGEAREKKHLTAS